MYRKLFKVRGELYSCHRRLKRPALSSNLREWELLMTKMIVAIMIQKYVSDIISNPFVHYSILKRYSYYIEENRG